MVCTAWWASKEKAESTESRARANQRPRTEWRLCMDVEFLRSVRERISKQRILLRSLGGWRYVNRKNLGGWPCFHPRIAGKISSGIIPSSREIHRTRKTLRLRCSESPQGSSGSKVRPERISALGRGGSAIALSSPFPHPLAGTLT